MNRDRNSGHRDIQTEERDTASVTPSRARAAFSGKSRCHAVTQRVTDAVTVTGPLKGPITITSTDKRFAGWMAGASAEQVDRFERERAGRSPKLNDEQSELFRICGQRIVDDHAAGRKIAPEALADGLRWAALNPLGRHLTSGDPADLERVAELVSASRQLSQAHSSAAQGGGGDHADEENRTTEPGAA